MIWQRLNSLAFVMAAFAAGLAAGLPAALLASDFVWEETTVGTNWNLAGNWDGTLGEWPGTNGVADTATIDGDFNTDDVFPILNLDLTSPHWIGALTLLNGGDLSLNTYSVHVDDAGGETGMTRVTGSGSELNIQTGSLDTDYLSIGPGGVIDLRGGTVQVDFLGAGVDDDIEDGGLLIGFGALQFAQSSSGIFDNDGGTITATGGTLTIERLGLSTATFDWDGDGNHTAFLNVFSNSTLIIDIPIATADAFNGTIYVGQNAEFQVNSDWTLGQSFATPNPAIMNLYGNLGTATVSGNAFSVDGSDSEINVKTGTAVIESSMTFDDGTLSIDPDATIQFEGVTTLDGGTIHNDGGTAIFAASATINNGCTLNNTNDADYVVDGSTVTVYADDFDMDGFASGGFTDWELTNGGVLNIRGDHLNLTQNDFDGDLTFSGPGVKYLDVDFGGNGTYDATWQLQGPVFVTEGNAFIEGPETLDVEAVVTVNPGATFALGTETEFSADGAITGGGGAVFNYDVAIIDDTTISVAILNADGAGLSDINIASGATLTINSNTIRSYDGSLFVPDATLTVNTPAWTVDTGNIVLSNYGFGGATFNGSGVATFGSAASLDVAGTISRLEAETVFQEGSRIALAGGGSELDVNATIAFDGGDVTEAVANGTLDLNGAVVTVTGDSSLTITHLQWGGSNLMIESGGILNIDVDDFDVANNEINAVITINSGDLNVRVASNVWQMDEYLALNNTTGTAARVLGDRLEIGDDAESSDADLVVGGTGLAQLSAAVTFYSDADVHIGSGAILQTGPVTFESVNASDEAEFTGSGQWHLAGINRVNEATTIDMDGGAVELDNAAVAALTANDTTINAPLTIHAATLADYGSMKMFLGTPTYSDLTIDNEGAETGTLTVNLDDPNGEWTVLSKGRLNLVNGAGPQTLLFGADVNLNGTTSVTGDVRVAARVDIGVGGTVHIGTGGSFNPYGGDLNEVNRIAGGAITGDGEVQMSNGRVLSGYGTVDTDVHFLTVGNRFTAAGGTLLFTGNFIGTGGTIGTWDPDGVLDVANSWDTAAAISVTLHGGEVTGARIDNNNSSGIHGHGRVTAEVINNTRISADWDNTLVYDNPANDWDGTPNTGQIIADHGTVELRDDAAFPFRGEVRAENGHEVFVNGFSLHFDSFGRLHLGDSTGPSAGTFRANRNVLFRGDSDVGGGLTTAAGAPASTISSEAVFHFVPDSTADLGSDLQLDTRLTVVAEDVAFSGPGALINLPSSTLRLLDGANVGVLIENQGRLVLGDSPGQVKGLDFQQDASGLLDIEIVGTGLSDYDQMTLSGVAQLEGGMEVSLFSYNPVVDDTFTIISAVGGRNGFFDLVDFTAAPLDPGLAWDVLYNPTNVQLTVVSIPPFSADFDEDWDVDGDDFDDWQVGFGTAVGASHGDGDADADGDVDGGDFLQWQQQYGSAAVTAARQTAVPEPNTAALALLLIGLFQLGSRASCARTAQRAA